MSGSLTACHLTCVNAKIMEWSKVVCIVSINTGLLPGLLAGVTKSCYAKHRRIPRSQIMARTVSASLALWPSVRCQAL